jgi:hypothetical protein
VSKYSQRQWERTVGWGKVPPEYKIKESDKDERIQPQDDKSTRDNSKDS